MSLQEIFMAALQMLVAGAVVSMVAVIVAVLALATELVRCKWRNVPFEAQIAQFVAFYLESFLPTMGFLAATTLILKILCKASEK